MNNLLHPGKLGGNRVALTLGKLRICRALRLEAEAASTLLLRGTSSAG
jgi:hypothetical protein